MATRPRYPHSRRAPAAERELVLAAMEGGAERDELVQAFLPLIAGVARLYRRSPSVDRCELMQEGVVGLLRALERYNPELGTPFWAYASWWVRQAMQQLVSEVTGPVVLSDRASRQLAKVKNARAQHLQAEGSEPSVQELALRTRLSRSQVEQLLAAERMPRALEQPVMVDGDRTGTIGDTLADPRSEQAYERVPERLLAAQVTDLLAELTPRQRLVLRGRYGLDGQELTLRRLAAALGLSAERVRQIEQSALDSLRAMTA